MTTPTHFFARIGAGAISLGTAFALGAQPVPAEHPLDRLGTWPAYGRDAGGARHSPLAQITPLNVHRLKVAWTFRTGELGEGVKDWKRSAFEATPVLHDGVLFLTTPATDVVAVDAATGTLRWRHESHARRDLHYSDGVSRGVSVWVDAARPEGAVCGTRIFAPTLDSRLLALDAATGRPCEDFGQKGAIDLLQDVGSVDEATSEWRNYLVTSPPAILDGRVIVGSSIGDNRAVKLEQGVVRAFDAVTGRLAWRWDPIPRDPANPGYGDWEPESLRDASAANAWAPLSVDAERHLVYVPTGSASPDFYGGERPGDNRWANSVVALDGATGTLRWGRHWCTTTCGTTTWRRSPRWPTWCTTAAACPRLSRRPRPVSYSRLIARPTSRCSRSSSGRCRRTRCRASAPRPRSRSQWHRRRSCVRRR